MLSEIVVNTLGQIIGDLFGKRIDQILEEKRLNREVSNAIDRAKDRFVSMYHDKQLAMKITKELLNTRDASIQVSIQHLLSDPISTQTDFQSFPSYDSLLTTDSNRSEVNRATVAFFRILGDEILRISQLQPFFSLLFQKANAENTRVIAESTSILVDKIMHLPQKNADHFLPEIADGKHPLHNLPRRNFTRFVGRQDEFVKLIQLMHPKTRHFLVTIDGVGGVGKSSLALELAYYYYESHESLPIEERFDAIIWISAKRIFLTADGIHQRRVDFNNLSDLHREIAVVTKTETILQSEQDERSDLIRGVLASKRILLIVDNLETVDDEELLAFLREMPEPTKAIVTTRHRIDIAYPLRFSGMTRLDALALMSVESANKSVTVPLEMAHELYRKTGGIPLGIVWSIGLMSLGHEIGSILRRLGSGHNDISRFCFSESSSRIRSKVSYRLLLAISLFDWRVNREMIGKAAGLGEDEINRDDGLAELLQLSLVNKNGEHFAVLPLTRNFLAEELSQQPVLESELRQNWIDCLTKFAQSYAEPDWRWRDLDYLRKEGRHLTTLANWCQQNSRLDVLLKIMPAISSYFDLTGQWSETVKLGKVGLEYAYLQGDNQNIMYLEVVSLAWVLSQQGDQEGAEQYMLDALRLADQIRDSWWQCEVRIKYSQILRRLNAFERAITLCNQAMESTNYLPNDQQKYVKADIEYEFGKIARDQKKWITAKYHFQRALNVFRYDERLTIFNPERTWGLISNLGYAEHQMGSMEEASSLYQQALQFFKRSGGTGYMITLLVRLASLEEQRDNLLLARRYALDALELSKRLGLVKEKSEAEDILKQLDRTM